MTDLKVGDHVRSTVSGRTSVIVAIDGKTVQIKFDDDQKVVWYGAHWLEKIA